MFWLFRLHHKMPSEYLTLPFFEKRIVRSFLYREISQLNEAYSGT